MTTAEQDVTEPLELEPDEREQVTEPLEREPDDREPESVELDPDELAEIERAVLEEELPASSEEELPKKKRVRIRVPKAEPKARPEPKARAEPKRRGRPPGSRNVRPAPLAPPPQHDPMEEIMSSMRERRQAHQERQHMFFQSFLP